MNKKMSEIENSKLKVGLTAATLPHWAKVLIAQQAEAALPKIDPHHIHHCSNCGCVLVSTNMFYQYFAGLCPECSSECSAKIQPSKGGN